MPNSQPVKSREEQTLMIEAMWVLFGAVAFVLWVFLKALEFRKPQVFEIEIIFLLNVYVVTNTIGALVRRAKDKEKLWPKPKLLYPDKRDRKYLKMAEKMDCTLLGYEESGAPVFVTDEQRAMQTNVPGASGAGKSTLLCGILEQDIRRGKAVIWLDGKADQAPEGRFSCFWPQRSAAPFSAQIPETCSQ